MSNADLCPMCAGPNGADDVAGEVFVCHNCKLEITRHTVEVVERGREHYAERFPDRVDDAGESPRRRRQFYARHGIPQGKQTGDLLKDIVRNRGGFLANEASFCSCVESYPRANYLALLGQPHSGYFRVCPFCMKPCPEDRP